MIRTVAFGLALAILGTTAIAQNLDAIKARQDGMKALGGQMKAIGAMAKGETPFDAAKAAAAFKVIADAAPKMVGLFPDNSMTGGDTAALPAVWSNKAGFAAAAKKMQDAATAAQASATDAAKLGEAMKAVGGTCAGCHTDFRVKKS